MGSNGRSGLYQIIVIYPKLNVCHFPFLACLCCLDIVHVIDCHHLTALTAPVPPLQLNNGTSAIVTGGSFTIYWDRPAQLEVVPIAIATEKTGWTLSFLNERTRKIYWHEFHLIPHLTNITINLIDPKTRLQHIWGCHF